MKDVNEILDFAIGREQAAHDFYLELAEKLPDMKETFTAFAREEMKHKKKLEAIKEQGTLAPTGKKVLDLKIADYLVDVEPSEDMDYQKILTLVMKREKAAFKLYNDLASRAEDPGLRDAFLALAQEEAKHKLHFELQYDEIIYLEN